MEENKMKATNETAAIILTPDIVTDLVYVYEAVSDLEKTTAALYGDSVVPTLGEGILGNLARIYGVVQNLTPLYDPTTDFEETEFGKLMESDLSPEEKASKIFKSIVQI